MNYEQALNYIHGTYKFGSKLGLNNIKRLLDLMGNPHQKLKYVHVAGTNGKGSTSSFISSILAESGYRTGLYISPYIERFTERIRINGDEIAEDDLTRITGFVKEKVDIMLANGENHPTEFEIITAIAFQYYYEKKCDIVVLEVGLGGRLDSTNVIDVPEVAVITTINYDHTDRLGNTLTQIAFEKAGIIKNKGDVVIYPQEPEVMEVFRKVCAERGARLHVTDMSSLELVDYDINRQIFYFGRYKGLTISLLGEHQVKNAAVAVKASEILASKGYGITEASIRKGLESTRWPGRFEVLLKKPYFVIDGAHNPEGSKALADSLRRYFPGKKVSFIFGVLKDKNYSSMIEAVLPLARRFITVQPQSIRAFTSYQLAEYLKSYCNDVIASDTIKEAVHTALDLSDPDDVVCAFGSLYYIGEVRKLVRSLWQNT